jgi:hypothetical protein
MTDELLTADFLKQAELAKKEDNVIYRCYGTSEALLNLAFLKAQINPNEKHPSNGECSHCTSRCRSCGGYYYCHWILSYCQTCQALFEIKLIQSTQ